MSWTKQSATEPSFPDVIWSRPENPNGAGKLLIIGGSDGNFADVARSYSDAENAGVGTIYLLVPDSLNKLTKHIPFINYAPSNISGSFARKALSEFLDLAGRAEGVLLAGDLGKSSETSLLLEDFLTKYTGWLIIAPEALESITTGYNKLLSRPETVLCLNYKNLRDLAIEQKSEKPITSDISKQNLAEFLQTTSAQNPDCYIIFEQNIDSTWICSTGEVLETIGPDYNPAKLAVWLIQQPEKPFQSLATSLVV